MRDIAGRGRTGRGGGKTNLSAARPSAWPPSCLSVSVSVSPTGGSLSAFFRCQQPVRGALGSSSNTFRPAYGTRARCLF